MAQDSQIFVSPAFNYNNSAATSAAQQAQRSLTAEGRERPSVINVSLVHLDYMEEHQFGLKMTVTDIPAGCAKISPLEYEASFIDNNYMDVEVKGFNRTTILQSADGSGCPVKRIFPSALIVLDVNDLKSREIRQIRFTDGNAYDDYNIIYEENGLSLNPDSMTVFKSAGGSLNYDFNLSSMVSLQVPMATAEDDLDNAVRNLAAKHALMPTSSEMRGNKKIYHFLDENGRTTSMLNENGFAELGNVTAPRPFSGQNGIENRAIPLKVFVTRHDVIL